MRLEVKSEREVSVVALGGSLDVSIQKKLKDKLTEVSQVNDKDIVVDFSDVSFIDSSCLGVLVAMAKRLREQKGDLKLSKLNDDVRSIFQITRLDKVFEVFDDNDQAIESFYR